MKRSQSNWKLIIISIGLFVSIVFSYCNTLIVNASIPFPEDLDTTNCETNKDIDKWAEEIANTAQFLKNALRQCAADPQSTDSKEPCYMYGMSGKEWLRLGYIMMLENRLNPETGIKQSFRNFRDENRDGIFDRLEEIKESLTSGGRPTGIHLLFDAIKDTSQWGGGLGSKKHDTIAKYFDWLDSDKSHLADHVFLAVNDCQRGNLTNKNGSSFSQDEVVRQMCLKNLDSMPGDDLKEKKKALAEKFKELKDNEEEVEENPPAETDGWTLPSDPGSPDMKVAERETNKKPRINKALAECFKNCEAGEDDKETACVDNCRLTLDPQVYNFDNCQATATCDTLINVLVTMGNKDRVKELKVKSLGYNPIHDIDGHNPFNGTDWLCLDENTKQTYGDDGTNPDKDEYSPDFNSDKSLEEVGSACQLRGLLGILVCPVVRFLSVVTESSYKVLAYMLDYPASILADSASPIRLVWFKFRDYANIVLTVLSLASIVMFMLSRNLNVYNLRKLFPQIVVTAILINLSFIICQVLVDVSNVAGAGIFDLLKTLKNNVLLAQDPVDTETGFLSSIIVPILAGTSVMVTVIITAPALLGIIFPLIIGMMGTAVIILFALLMRQAMITLLIILSPVAFALSLLPNTKNIFNRWKKLFFGSLILYPIISMLFGVGGLAYTITEGVSESSWQSLLSVMFLFIPLAATPIVVKQSTRALPMLGASLSRLVGSSKDPGSLGGLMRDKSKNSKTIQSMRRTGTRGGFNRVTSALKKVGLSSAAQRLTTTRDSLSETISKNPTLAKTLGKSLWSDDQMQEFDKGISEYKSDFDKDTIKDILSKYKKSMEDANTSGKLTSQSDIDDFNRQHISVMVGELQGDEKAKALVALTLRFSEEGLGDEILIKEMLRQAKNTGAVNNQIISQTAQKIANNYREANCFHSAAGMQLMINNNNGDIFGAISHTPQEQKDAAKRVMFGTMEGLDENVSFGQMRDRELYKARTGVSAGTTANYISATLSDRIEIGKSVDREIFEDAFSQSGPANEAFRSKVVSYQSMLDKESSTWINSLKP